MFPVISYIIKPLAGDNQASFRAKYKQAAFNIWQSKLDLLEIKMGEPFAPLSVLLQWHHQPCMTKNSRYRQSATCLKKYCTKMFLYSAGVQPLLTLLWLIMVLLTHLSWILYELSFSSYLFVTLSHKSSVLFLLLLCVVLVLYSYQESTLLWRPWIPLMKINLCVKKNLHFWLLDA